MSVEGLLSEISKITEKYKLLNKETGGGFNIFEAADISTDEVTVCRVLYELLSPKGSHAQGAAFLKPFIENVLHIDMTNDELNTAEVYRELGITDDRRIDLVIRTNERFIPIEVKINAKDREKQCYDYYQKAKGAQVVSPVYYLTSFGKQPSEISADGLTKCWKGYKEVECISFAYEIKDWLEHCVTGQDVPPPIREVLFQFIDAIRNFTNQPEDKMEKDIIEVITASEDSIKSAVLIEESLVACKTAMLQRLIEAVDERVDAGYLLNQYSHIENPWLITDYYSQRSSTYPGISYMYRRDVKPGIDIWVRMEIDYRVFAGYCVMKGETPAPSALTTDELEQILGIKPKTESHWAYWEYLPLNTKPASPNFKDLNDAFYELFDPDKFNVFVRDCAAKINDLLKRR